MNEYFRTLIEKLEEWSIDASVVLNGDAELFPEFPTTVDALGHSLIEQELIVL